jgi:Cof subfamily protein (haloacid dehalogenase superfamily)
MVTGQPPSRDIRLVVADVDGTLLTPGKELTERARLAVRRLHAAGVALTVASARPPRGIRPLVEPLRLTAPLAAFNGGMLVSPDLSVLEEHVLPPEVTVGVIASIEACGLDVWVYRGADWLVRRSDGPRVDWEVRAVRFEPTVVAGFSSALDRVVKVVAVSDDPGAVARCEPRVCGRFEGGVSAARSEPYQLDVTHPRANKGAAVRRLSELLKVSLEETATIGDAPADVPMFVRSGLSIAMGNAGPLVRQAARSVTTSNAEEGFAKAVEEYVLRRVPDRPVARLAGWHSPAGSPASRPVHHQGEVHGHVL